MSEIWNEIPGMLEFFALLFLIAVLFHQIGEWYDRLIEEPITTYRYLVFYQCYTKPAPISGATGSFIGCMELHRDESLEDSNLTKLHEIMLRLIREDPDKDGVVTVILTGVFPMEHITGTAPIHRLDAPVARVFKSIHTFLVGCWNWGAHRR